MSLIKSTSLVLVGLWATLSTAKGGPAFQDAFIVESTPGNDAARQGDFLGEVANQVAQLGTSCQASHRRTFDSPHFTGASFDLKCDDSLDQLKVLAVIQEARGVHKAWPVAFVKHQMALPGQGARGRERSKRDELEQSLRVANGSSVDGFSTHKMGKVDRLHNAGITGAGVKIAVVDSGFDTSVHGLSQTKIAYSVDITGEFPDARDNCSFHGTHVLGIVGAKSADNMYNVSGVAPDATYELYRIQKCATSGATTDDLIAGFTEAAKRGADIITCSYGGSGAFPEEPWSLAATRIAATGVYVSLPAGNDGPGPFSGSIPATAPLVSTAGAADNIVQPCLEWHGSVTKNDQTKPFSFVPGGELNFPDTPLTVWSPIPAENDAYPSNCSFVTSEPPKDPANTIAIMDSLKCFVDSDGVRLESSPKYNISYIMYYMPKEPEGQTPRCARWTESGFPNTKGSLTTSYAFGSQVLAELGKGHQISVKIPNNPEAGQVSLSNKKSASGGSVAWFSSWGPTWDGRTMPTYVTPGSDILSTYPKRLGSWGVIGGTSMATPYAAGVAALIKQQFPKLANSQIQSILASTAQPIKFNDRQKTYYTGNVKDFFAPILQQGGGLIDAYAASQTRTHLNVTNLSFNDTANRVPSVTFEISNTGDKELSYVLNHVGAASGYFMNTSSGARYNLTGATGLPVYAELNIRPSQLTLGPGKTASVTVSVAAEPDLPDGTSFFGGYVTINATAQGKAADHVRIPYTGFGHGLVSLPAINKDLAYGGATTSDGKMTRDGDGRVFVCEYNQTASVPCTFDGLYPGVQAALVTGASRNMTISLVDHKTGAAALPNDVNLGSSAAWGKSSYWYWDGTDSNRSFVPAGDYFWRVKVLRLNGRLDADQDYDVLDTVWWTLKYTANSTLPVRR
ncbi:hypothetical protein PpBr36_08876 [Pyricularia pennisetigena]|uniref:hypothetical protein n=1 Tax=Pyricularia pennisetigena TaxID=1578925 RepID=UPI00114D5ED1|nr:hypothetical protein PpBr36_08876 [Pyricularia pennisetigena]TLS24939.1 hypothetical protein PpBr36_08876 [Pyricularia pennisetigena]